MKRYSVIRDVGYQPHHVYDHHEQIVVERFLWKRDAKRHTRYLNEQEERKHPTTKTTPHGGPM